MPILILLTIGLQIICGIHAVRHGNIYPWIFIIIMAPLLGCAIYTAMVWLPELERVSAKAGNDITKLIDPDRDYRARLKDAELVGSADSKRMLAEECLRRGDTAEAVKLLEAIATGVYADDPALLHALARARFLNGDAFGAQKALDDLRTANPEWSSADGHLLYARALEEQGKTEEARIDYEALVRYFPGEEAKCRLALLYQKMGRVEAARQLFEGVVKSVDGAPKHYKRAQQDWLGVARRNLGA